MSRALSLQRNASILLTILGTMALFHGLILGGIIPYAIVWGGRLGSAGQMQIFETVALVVTLFMMWIVAMRGGVVRSVLPPWLLTTLLWVITLFFLLNTLGNLLSETWVERLVFTPITLLLAFLCFRLTQNEVGTP